MPCYDTVVWQLSVALSKKISAVLLPAVLLSASYSYADTAYVTDSITVSIFNSAELQGAPLERLPSGALVDVLQSTADVAKVKSGSGKIGWMRTTFLTTNLPATIQLENADHELNKANAALGKANKEVEQLQKKAKKAGKDVAWMKVEMEKARKKAAKLEAQLKSKQGQASEIDQQADTLESEINQLKALNDSLEQRLAATLLINGFEEAEEENIPQEAGVAFPWRIVTLILGLVAGFAAGYFWLDQRVRKRFGGVRVY